MIQVKEFIDSDNSFAEKKVNQFLETLDESQVVNICYGSVMKATLNGTGQQRSSILVVYRTSE
ncbi:sporulation protein Cse60 [Paenibacillus sp. N4]|uniref:sporulation protein Cse60 n=1 Tax=Paenibacillus vietnamensis TaxID=2590547 RepID=UPI001CD09D51|nr:sporulation protein Cse60 [Paenibacillus vietnamensis]MCA0755145.1 sporulation protein Cse60 [Paenibacillus vietnamensis]